MKEFKELAILFNSNLKKIKRELTLKQVTELYTKYKPINDGHLAKILSLRNIIL